MIAQEANKTKVEISGELKKWHKITLTFDGPETSEMDKLNPFMNYRFDVYFTHKESGRMLKIPGYFAADGNAGETSATTGNKWRVHLAPDAIGTWTYKVNFRVGNWRAISERKNGGKSWTQDGQSTIHTSNNKHKPMVKDHKEYAQDTRTMKTACDETTRTFSILRRQWKLSRNTTVLQAGVCNSEKVDESEKSETLIQLVRDE